MAKKTSTVVADDNPLVSIVTPVYNGEVFFADTIKTVFDQTYKNWEWIIVDDASTDDTMETIRRNLKEQNAKKVEVIGLKRNGGAAKARNVGIEKAKGRYLCFIDADDFWVPRKIEKQVRFMQKKGCEFSFTGYEFADTFGKPNGKIVSVPDKISYSQALKNTTIWTSTVMFDMTGFSKMDVNMPDVPSEDTATWWKVLKEIDYAYGLDEVLSIYRRSGKTLSSNKIIAIKRIWNLYRNYEELGLFSSAINFVGYIVNAVKRRV